MTVLAVLGTAIASHATAGDIVGTLRAPPGFGEPPAAEGASSTYYWDEWNGVVDPLPNRADLARQLSVVLVGSAPGKSPSSTVRVSGGDFLPSTFVVKAGTTLRIENDDACAHELYSHTLAGFTPLQTAAGNARTVAVPNAGHFVIRDRLYPHIEAHLHAVAGLVARAEVQPDGQFRFADVPEGTYTLKVFHRDREVVSRPGVTVSGDRQMTIDPIALGAAR